MRENSQEKILKKLYTKSRMIIAAAVVAAFIISISYAQTSLESIRTLVFSWRIREAGKAMAEINNIPPGLRALYDFYDGNYSDAYDNFKKSPESYPELYHIVKDLKSLRENFELTESKYFKIYATGKDRVLALYAGDILDKAAENLEKYFNYKPQYKKVILEIYPDRESFQTASTLTDKHMKASGAVGICKFNRLMVSSPAVLKFGYGWPNTITHEYVHYVIGKITGLMNMPLWLNEGLARHLEETWKKPVSSFTPDEFNRLYLNRVDDGWVPLEKMKYGMPNLDDRDEVSLAFAQVHSMAGYMIDIYSFKTISNLLNGLLDKSPEESFKEFLKLSQAEFYKNWQEYIRKKEINYTPGAAPANYAFKDDPVSAVSEWVSQTAATDIYLARKFMDRKKYRLAEKKYRDALAKDPGNSVILTRLAKAEEKNGKTATAKEHFLKAAQNNPNYAPPYKYLGILYFNGEDYLAAERFMKKYIYIQPFDPEAHEYLKNIYGRIDKPDEFDMEDLKRREIRALEIISES